MLEELEAQRESLRINLAQLQLKHHKFSKEEIVEWISRFKDGDINDHSFQKEIIDIFVNSVYVYDDKLLLTYNYKNGTQTLTLDEIHAVLGSDIEHGTPPKQRNHPIGWFFCFGRIATVSRNSVNFPVSSKMKWRFFESAREISSGLLARHFGYESTLLHQEKPKIFWSSVFCFIRKIGGFI